MDGNNLKIRFIQSSTQKTLGMRLKYVFAIVCLNYYRVMSPLFTKVCHYLFLFIQFFRFYLITLIEFLVKYRYDHLSMHSFLGLIRNICTLFFYIFKWIYMAKRTCWSVEIKGVNKKINSVPSKYSCETGTINTVMYVHVLEVIQGSLS